jgi:hypothetical protein
MPSDELTRLEEAIRNPARPRTVEEAMALGDDWGAIDLSAIEEETFPLPIQVPDRHRWFLVPRRIRARKPDVAVHNVVADLSHRSAIRRRQAAGYLASWPSSADVERALLQTAKTDTDSWVVAFAAMSLAVHQYRGTAFLCGLVSAAVARQTEADIVGALLLAVAVSAAWNGSAGKLLTARECIERTGARPEYREVSDEILLALRAALERAR